MTGWFELRTPEKMPGKAFKATMALALLLVAAVPLALLAGLFLMLLGHVVGGLALFGGSVLVAGLAVVVAGASGKRALLKMALGRQNVRVVRLDGSGYSDVPEPEDSGHPNVVRLDRNEYTNLS
jgi:hypothetical protein